MNSKIKQFIAFGVCSVVALALCLGVLVVTVNNLENEQNITQNKEIKSQTQLDDSKQTLSTYFNALVFNTADRFVKTKTYTDISVDEIAVENTNNRECDEALLNFAKDKMLPAIDSYYEKDSEGSFKADNSTRLSLVLDEKALNSACYSIGQINENGESVFDEEGNLVDNEFYYLTFGINGETVLNDKKLAKMFLVESDSKAQEKFTDDIKDSCKIKYIKTKPELFIIKTKVNRVTDEIEYINVIRNYNIQLDAEFINKAEFLGKKEIAFTYTVTDTYEFSYAGISFLEDEITIGQGEEQMLSVNAVIDDDSEYTVGFVSSDEDVVSVDEMGYVKGLKNCDTPAIVTVKLSYLGETFTDTCIVNVSAE